MSEPIPIPRSKSMATDMDEAAAADIPGSLPSVDSTEYLTPGYQSSTPGSPYLLSRNNSYTGSQSMQEDWEIPLDKITFFDIFENLSLPSKLEKWQATLAAQKDKLAKRQERIRTSGNNAKDRAMAEWRKRVPTADEQLAKYRSRMKKSVDDLSKRWNERMTITMREKVSFISAVLNVFLTGYLIGAVPEYFYYWFTIQLAYFMPIRFITYRRKGYHYFLADLCYFVNFLCLLCIWVFPRSKRLFISTYCLAYGNNAVAIAMWRNSLVFHSLDKVTSLFIHVMPPAALHCIVHLTSEDFLQRRFPAVYDIKHSAPGLPEHYTLTAMLGWATIPYIVWQLSYHFFITVRRREQIAAGRPTSFTWLRKSYAKTWLGKFVISLPESLQEPAFMLIQYLYALLTIIPCPLWFWYRWASATFLMAVFTWSVWNGAVYYMDIFGKRFEKELEQMKREVARWQNSPGAMMSPPTGPLDGEGQVGGTTPTTEGVEGDKSKRKSIDRIPLLDETPSQNGKDEEQPGLARATGAQILHDSESGGLLSDRKTTSASGSAKSFSDGQQGLHERGRTVGAY
ncbi:Glycerophosphocholine acyltransferase 1 [Exophiala dermatitidis]